MLMRTARRLLLGRKRRRSLARDDGGAASTRPSRTSNPATVALTQPESQPEWIPVLTASLRGGCTAPADELILHAFDLYCDDLHAPFRARQRKLAGLHTDICAGVAQLQALAPEMVQRAMARHRIEFDHFIDHKGDA